MPVRGRDVCQLVDRWQIAPELAERVLEMARLFWDETRHDLEIFSGFRSAKKQRELERQGRPTAPVELSNHTICPARAVDLRIQGVDTVTLWQTLSRIAFEVGLRHGGGSSLDDQGLPTDRPHFDLGPRQDAVARAFREQGSLG